MPRKSAQQLLADLAGLKTQFGTAPARKILTTLERLSTLKFADAESLILLHETLLFLRAYPQSAAIVRTSEVQLKTFSQRVAFLIDEGADLSQLEHPEMSGMAGLYVQDTFTYDIVRWLAARYPQTTAIDWEWFEGENRLAEIWPAFIPLLEEDAFVEANVPYREWLKASRGNRTELGWLLKRFNGLQKSDKEKAELYNSQQLYVRWTPPYESTRTGMRLPDSQVFYHRGPLIRRRDLSFRAELERESPPLRKLLAKQGQRILDLALVASTTRYRELYGFTHGDPHSVFRAQLGRGVELFLTGLPPERRLPLRAYHAAMIFKNGVPIGYFEGLTLFERMESGFNLYYTFRDGETAWLYVRTLNVMSHFTGVRAFSLDPYQIGHENEEGIESGAFWFYRKLGFRPTRSSILELTEREEHKLATRKDHRTSTATLRKLAAGTMILELDQERTGDWDSFQIRSIGLRVAQKLAGSFGGDAEQMRRAALEMFDGAINRDMAVKRSKALEDFAVVLSLISDLGSWTLPEKERLCAIIQAKATAHEIDYLALMQQHPRLRREFIKLGYEHLSI